MTSTLTGRRLLVVEDEYLLAVDLVSALEDQGAQVIGPAPSVDAALDIIDGGEPLDGAVLDLNLQGEMAFPVADALLDREIPFVFATGYDQADIPRRYHLTPRLEKPVGLPGIVRALFG